MGPETQSQSHPPSQTKTNDQALRGSDSFLRHNFDQVWLASHMNSIQMVMMVMMVMMMVMMVMMMMMMMVVMAMIGDDGDDGDEDDYSDLVLDVYILGYAVWLF